MARLIAGAAVLLVMLAACSKAPAPVTAPAASAGSSEPPASTPASVPKGAIRYYQCVKLVSQAEVRQATGLSNAKFFNEEKTGPYKGQTYCQFFGGNSDSIAVSVFTGPSFAKVFQPLAAAAQNLPVVPGVGDSAKWSAQSDAFGARVGSVGVTVVFRNTNSGPLGISDPKGAAIAIAKLVLSRL